LVCFGVFSTVSVNCLTKISLDLQIQRLTLAFQIKESDF